VSAVVAFIEGFGGIFLGLAWLTLLVVWPEKLALRRKPTEIEALKIDQANRLSRFVHVGHIYLDFRQEKSANGNDEYFVDFKCQLINGSLLNIELSNVQGNIGYYFYGEALELKADLPRLRDVTGIGPGWHGAFVIRQRLQHSVWNNIQTAPVNVEGGQQYFDFNRFNFRIFLKGGAKLNFPNAIFFRKQESRLDLTMIVATVKDGHSVKDSAGGA
jgi:hypothetical protein